MFLISGVLYSNVTCFKNLKRSLVKIRLIENSRFDGKVIIFGVYANFEDDNGDI